MGALERKDLDRSKASEIILRAPGPRIRNASGYVATSVRRAIQENEKPTEDEEDKEEAGGEQRTAGEDDEEEDLPRGDKQESEAFTEGEIEEEGSPEIEENSGWTHSLQGGGNGSEEAEGWSPEVEEHEAEGAYWEEETYYEDDYEEEWNGNGEWWYSQ